MLLFRGRCILELKFAIYHRAASLLSQASSVDVWHNTVLAEASLTRGVFKHQVNKAVSCILTLFLIQWSWVIIMFRCYSALCACVQWRKWCRKWSHGSSVTSLNHLVRLRSYEKMGWAGAKCEKGFCAKTIVKELCNFELYPVWRSRGKRKRRKKRRKKTKKNERKKEKHFGHLGTSGSVL